MPTRPVRALPHPASATGSLEVAARSRVPPARLQAHTPALPNSPDGGFRMTETLPVAGATLTQLEAFRRMFIIRLFEQRCLELSAETIAGSIHLCGGQEAIPVGARSALEAHDRVVTTYRGHGWAIEWGVPLLDLLAEICQRGAGINGGRGGSPYLMAPEYGFIGENSIVGAGVPIATGVALAAKAADDGRVCVVSIGDGAMNQGATHEGLNFAAVRELPVIFMLENNDWSEMTPIAATASLSDLSERAAGYGIPGVTIDGTDPFAVAEAVSEAAARARSGNGPTLIEAKAVRLMAHYNRDIEHYRTTEDKAEAAKRDPLIALRRQLVEAGSSAAEIDGVESSVREQIEQLVEKVVAMAPPDAATARDHVVAVPKRTTPTPPSEESTREMPYWQAVNEALRTELGARPDTLLYGEDVGLGGGIFGCTRGLQTA